MKDGKRKRERSGNLSFHLKPLIMILFSKLRYCKFLEEWEFVVYNQRKRLGVRERKEKTRE